MCRVLCSGRERSTVRSTRYGGTVVCKSRRGTATPALARLFSRLSSISDSTQSRSVSPLTASPARPLSTRLRDREASPVRANMTGRASREKKNDGPARRTA